MFRPVLAALAALLAGASASAQTIDMDQLHADEQFRGGVRAFHSGYYGEAVQSFEKALSLKPQAPLPRLWLGNALYKSGFEEAGLAEWKYLLAEGAGASSQWSTGVLRDRVETVSFQRGLSRDLRRNPQYVVAAELDTASPEVYPLKRPSAVHARADGSVYVVGFGSNEIVLLDVNNEVERVLQGGLKGYDRPFDCLEVRDRRDGEAYLFITEYGDNQVIKSSLEGQRLGQFGGGGRGPGKLLGPQYLAADSKGYLYVTDWGNRRVAKYDLDGTFILTMGQSVLSGPTGIAVGGERVYVADRARKRIQIFDTSGNALGAVGEGVLDSPEGMVFQGPDSLLVADGMRILRYRIGLETWETLLDLSPGAGHLSHLTVSPNGELYAVDFDRNRIFVVSEMGALYSSLTVQVERVVSAEFPKVAVDVSVADRSGKPLFGLKGVNFRVRELHRDVLEPGLALANTDPLPVELSVVVEASPAMEAYRSQVGEAVQSIRGQLGTGGDLQIISAGERPALEAAFGSTRLEAVQAATRRAEAQKWRLDLGVRLATTELIPRRSRKSVVFLTRGALSEESFGRYTLAEVLQYLKNNFISFQVVSFGADPAPELRYLARETGGRVYDYFGPAGIGSLVEDIRARVTPLYTLTYTSVSDPGFGERYLDLEVEVILHRRSGRTESGYFAPLSNR